MSDDLTNVYNSVSWNNGAQHMDVDNGKNNRNITFKDEVSINNEDIYNGPNFVDPLNDDEEARDYHIRPSLTLLNQGNNDNYLKNVIKVVSGSNEVSDIPDTEVDLGNSQRRVDGTIDIGAYEYEAPLQPIVYVKADLTEANPDGTSWEKALGDLQGAVDLVGIYANNNPGKNGYVFVHNNVKPSENNPINLRLTLLNTKVYGGMNDETSVALDENFSNVEKVVDGLLDKRAGLIERDSKSTLSGVTINAENSIIDGFLINGVPTINNGYLSTSIVKGNVTGGSQGVLYNSLVTGNVSNVKAVNVTATGTISMENNNNRAGLNDTDLNKYVADDYWIYQLNETDKVNIDGGKNKKRQRNARSWLATSVTLQATSVSAMWLTTDVSRHGT